jgi:WD40 repeat protein
MTARTCAVAVWLCVASLSLQAQSSPAEVVTIATPAEAQAVVVSRSGRVAAAVCADDQLRIWSMPQGTLLQTIALNQRRLTSVTISPDGSAIAAGDFKGEYSIWLTATGAEHAHLGLGFYPYALAFSPDSSRLAIAPVGEPVQIYDVAARRTLVSLPRRVGGTGAIAFSRDGNRLATADTDTVVRLYDARTGELLKSNADFLLEPLAASFSADGQHVFTGGADKFVATLDAATGQTLKMSGKLDDPVATIDVSPDGALIASLLMHADNLLLPGPVIVSDAATGRRVSQWLPKSLAMWSGWTEDGRLLLATSDKSAVHIWHVR